MASSSIQYKKIEIGDVVKTAFENFETTGFQKSCVGMCGIGQAATYYAALKHGVPEKCIKLCQANDILRGCRHVFTILILDEIYLVDLTFGQYLCLWDQDKESNLMKKYFSADQIEKFLEKGYQKMTEEFLMIYYRFLRRFCIANDNGKYSGQTPFDDIALFPEEEIYIKQGSFNLLEMTIFHDWSSIEVDYSVQEIVEWGWNKTGSWF